MNAKISNAFKTAKGFLYKHSPEILTGIGITGMCTSTVLAVKATPKALRLIDNAEKDKGDKLTVVETVKVAWKPYIPSTAIGVASISCIIGASAVNTKRNAALATAYAISERTFVKYKDKVIDTIGEKKEREIREKIAQDDINQNPVSDNQVIITSKGNTLFRESITGRYFRSDWDKIQKIVNELNRNMLQENHISLSQFYYEIGLEPTTNSDYIGWNVDKGLIEICPHATIAENNEPCIVIDYDIMPFYEFDKNW